jgi:MFS family permease
METVPAVTVKKGVAEGAIVSIAAWIGFAMTYFDSSIYAVAAPFVAPFFFPASNYLTAVLLFLLTYPVGYLGRPVGGIVFAHYGDKTGRRVPWLTSVAGMGIATVLIGGLPTYAQAGVLSTASLVILRLCQGIFLGGEYSGSAVISAEAVPDRLRGLFQGLVRSGLPFGIVLASVDLALANVLYPGQAMQGFGWRFMFFFGIIPLLVAVASRYLVNESPEWEVKVKREEKIRKERSSLATLFRQYWRIVCPVLLFTFGYDVVAQIAAQYLPTFLRSFTPATVLTIAVAAGIVPNVIRGVWGPIAGYISDVLRNRKWLLYFQAIAVAILAYPLFGLVRTGEFNMVLVGATIIQVVFMISVVLGYLYQMELVPTNVRWGLTGIAEVGTSFAAFAPFITTYVGAALVDPLLAITAVVVIGAVIEVLALLLLPRDRAGRPFE